MFVRQFQRQDLRTILAYISASIPRDSLLCLLVTFYVSAGVAALLHHFCVDVVMGENLFIILETDYLVG